MNRFISIQTGGTHVVVDQGNGTFVQVNTGGGSLTSFQGAMDLSVGGSSISINAPQVTQISDLSYVSYLGEAMGYRMMCPVPVPAPEVPTIYDPQLDLSVSYWGREDLYRLSNCTELGFRVSPVSSRKLSKLYAEADQVLQELIFKYQEDFDEYVMPEDGSDDSVWLQYFAQKTGMAPWIGKGLYKHSCLLEEAAVIERTEGFHGVNCPLHDTPLREWYFQQYGQHAYFMPTLEQMKRHVHLLGSTGSGKTNALLALFKADVFRGHSVVILDLRGDLVDGALSLIADEIDCTRIKILDLREKVRPLGFNPLQGSFDYSRQALLVLEALKSESSSWGPQLEETMRNALLLLAFHEESLASLERLMYDRSFRANLVAAVDDENLRAYWQRYDQLSSEKQQTLASPILNKVSGLLATPHLRSILTKQNQLNLDEQLNDQGSITLIALAADQLHGSARVFGDMILSSIIQTVFSRASNPGTYRNPVRLYVDEFENFDSTKFESALVEGRRFGLSLVLAHQNLVQLQPKFRAQLLANAALKIVMRVGAEDAATMYSAVTRGQTGWYCPDFGPGQCMIAADGQEVAMVQLRDISVEQLGWLDTGRYINAVYELSQPEPYSEPPPLSSLPSPTPAPLQTIVQPVSTVAKPAGLPGSAANSDSLDDWLGR